ncbi:MAG: hypothetical protein QXU32_09370 [Nitrososphaerales archaeon]
MTLNHFVAENQAGLPVHVKKRMIERSLYNPANWRRFMKWWHSNVLTNLDEGAALDEVDKTLTYSEAIDHITSKHPEWFANKHRIVMAKQIVFLKNLIPLLITGEIRCTYRNRRLYGTYYVITNRFKREPSLVIEVISHELVNVDELTDGDTRLAGIASATELINLLKKWYGGNKMIFRNWLSVKQILEV